MTTILKGENKLLVRRMLKADTTALLRTALGALQVELWQGPVRLVTYVYGTDAELVANPGDVVGNEVRLEITAGISAALLTGTVTEIWQFSLTDSAYVEGSQIARVSVTDLSVV